MRLNNIFLTGKSGLTSAKSPVHSSRLCAINPLRRTITALPANHVVPAVGYHFDSGRASLVFSGDTTSNDALWKVVNKINNLRHVIIETAFSNSERELAVLSKHLCPSLLVDELAKFTGNADIFITHLKPGEMELIMREIDLATTRLHPKMLFNNQFFEL
jgi:ribonuclease BN (tRNA processing enzyme)